MPKSKNLKEKTMTKILIVEDDKELNSTVGVFLSSEGFEVEHAYNGIDALTLLGTQDFDLILTDIMMPMLDGFGLAERIRAKDKKTPIVFMTARDDKPSKQLGYKLEIDDYITKPFDLDELVMRIRALLRRSKTQEESKLVVGNLTMDKDEHTAYVDGTEIGLTVREFDILFKLLENPKKTFTRSALMDEFWDYDSSATSRTVDVYMAKLREKTSKCKGFEILTVHGLGYKVVLK